MRARTVTIWTDSKLVPENTVVNKQTVLGGKIQSTLTGKPVQERSQKQA